MTAGLNRFTGQPLAGFAHVEQSLGVIFTTRLTSRIMERTFGSPLPGILGRPLTRNEINIKLAMAIIVPIELWDPRFKVVAFDFPEAQNSASQLQQGRFGVTILGQYMPNALEGDFTVAATVSVVL